MKFYLTEGRVSSATSRKPFKILQNLQLSLNSKMASSSTALKTITNRQKRTDQISVQSTKGAKQLDSNTANARSRTPSTFSSSHRDILDNRTVNQNTSIKKEDCMTFPSQTSDSANSSGSSIGSLTSSPKWSHIKNKFENANMNETSKQRSSSPRSMERNRMKRSDIKNACSVFSETKASEAKRIQNLGTKKDSKSTTGSSVKQLRSSVSDSKSEISEENSKYNSNKRHDESTQRRYIYSRDRQRSSSPKNSLRSIASNCKTSKNSLLSTSSINRTFDNPGSLSPKNYRVMKALTNSTVSLSSNSSKNSEVDTLSISSNISCSSTNNSQSNIPIACSSGINCTTSRSNSKSDVPSGKSPRSSPVNLNGSAFQPNTGSKNSAEVVKIKACEVSEMRELRPVSAPIELNKNQYSKKSLLSEKDRLLLKNISNINKSCRTSLQGNSLNANSLSNTNSNNVEKIKDLVRHSYLSKTVWVKDCAGNWTKKLNLEPHETALSKVAKLKSKFHETIKEPSLHLSKSVTTNNIPSKTSLRPLAKSSTTSRIHDQTSSIELNENKTNLSNGRASNLSKSDQTRKFLQSKRNSVDSNAKLNIVQRAILNYEGNISLLSPETQRRLKLVDQKVQSQTDDGKILRTRVKSDGFKFSNRVAGSDNTESKQDLRTSGEPILPARDFLNRYQLNKEQKKTTSSTVSMNKAKSSPSERQIPSKIESGRDKTNLPNNDSTEKKTVKPDHDSSNVNGLTIQASGENRENLTLDLSGDTLSVKTSTSSCLLLPNTSFLWRTSAGASSELSKRSAASTVSLTSSDYQNYFDIQNFYTTVDVEVDKESELSEDLVYIDSQGSNSSENNYASSNGPYENVQHKKEYRKKNFFEGEWTDPSDDDCFQNSSVISTVKRRKKRINSKSEDLDAKKQTNYSSSFTESNVTLINEVENDNVDSDHFYEPVYESLGDYLKDQNEIEDDNCSISLSPDDQDSNDFMQCSLTSLESAESAKREKDDHCPPLPKNTVKEEDKKSNKITQLKRHLSWTKNDIRLELSSKFNKIKIKKNGQQSSTEIGVKVQGLDSVNTSPKKKTFIKCILKQKSASSLPIKRSPSPKKDSSLFYVHLSMGSEQHNSIPLNNTIKDGSSRPSSEPSALPSDSKITSHRPRFRKMASGPTVQRPKTPPPLPPSSNCSKNTPPEAMSQSMHEFHSSKNSNADNDCTDFSSHLYTCLDPDFFQEESESRSLFYDTDDIFSEKGKKSGNSSNTSKDGSNPPSRSSSCRSSRSLPITRKASNEFYLPLLPMIDAELLKSPFEEEPMYQFYQKDVQQRTLWCNAEGSESEFEDDASSKYSDSEYQTVVTSSKPPVLQSQMSAMDLVHGDGGQRTLWGEVPEVKMSGILKTISSKDRKIQEAMFEVITSEASYLKSLNFLIDHFVQCPVLEGSPKNILNKREKDLLFSDIQPVRDVSARLLADLEKRWLENIVLSNICDIIYHHASKYFSVYVKYCSNQLYQERLFRELKDKRPEFQALLKKLESNPVCQSLDMHSFLMLPMQRITRLPLLIDAIFHRLSIDSPIYDSCKMALATVNKLVAECNEGARRMERMEEMLVISQKLDFKDCKGLGLLSASRWLVKKGELVQLILDASSRRTFGRSSRWCKIQLYLFLFTDLLVVTRKKSDDSYSVIDFCPRNMLQVLHVDENMPPLPIRLPSSYKNVFQIIMLNNKEGKTVEMLLSCLLESDRTRWMSAMTPVKSDNPDEKIYEEWDWPQFQCTHAYIAQQPDELSLEEADVVNVLRKMSDGWFEGERIRDGVRGWFPSSHAVEIITSHVRARNLRQRYRLLMLSQTYLEEQYKSQTKK